MGTNFGAEVKVWLHGRLHMTRRPWANLLAAGEEVVTDRGMLAAQTL